MADIDEMIKEEWRSLGFYYNLEENENISKWAFYGSRDGLSNFAKILEKYTSNESNDSYSEHRHYGPYRYLTIMTLNSPSITNNHIAGSINDLKSLKNIFVTKLNHTEVGQTFTIGSDYGATNNGVLEVFVMNDDFDPVSMDGNYNHDIPSTSEERDIYKAINHILYNDWDPIGIANHAPENEYQTYTTRIFSLFLRGADIDTIADKLHEIETSIIGVSGSYNHCKKIADKIVSLR